MMLRTRMGFGRFVNCDAGAVTVDWVVLTATVIVMFILAVEPIFVAMDGVINEITTEISSYSDDKFGAGG